MQITEGPIEGLLIIQPRIFNDDRGYFFEMSQAKRYQEAGLPPFVQDNLSHSTANVLRGLHYQLPPHAQGKLVSVLQGEVWDVAVDIRKSSPTFGQYFGLVLSDTNHTQFYIPPGFAHGFCVLSPTALFHYKCTDYYAPQAERGVAWNDQQIQVPWPVQTPVLASKDEKYPSLAEIAHAELFA